MVLAVMPMFRSKVSSFSQDYLLNLNSSRVLVGALTAIGIFGLVSKQAFFQAQPSVLLLSTLVIVVFGLGVLVSSWISLKLRDQFYYLCIAFLVLSTVGFLLNLHFTQFATGPAFILVAFALITPWFFLEQSHLILFQVFMVLGLVLTVLITPESQPDSNLLLYSFIGLNLFTFFLANSKILSLKKLMEENRNNADLVHFLQEGLIQVDSNYNMTYINPRLGEMLGRDPQEFIGRFLITEVIPKDMQPDQIKRMMNRGNEMENRYFMELLHADGQRVPVQVSVSPRYDLDQKLLGFNILLVDLRNHMDQLHKAKQDRLALENQLRDSNAKKLELERFASTIANDLRSPLEVINRGVQLLYSFSEKDQPMFEQYMMEIEANVGRVYEIMQAVLLYSVTDVTQMNPVKLDLNQVVKEVVSSLQPLLEAHEVDVNLDQMPSVKADKVQMLRLFRNFIESSITRRGEVAPSIFLSYSEDSDKGMYIFSLQDNGVGISREDYDNIFRIFQEEEVPDVDAKSIGFGLSICNKIINNHGGKLWFTSNAGKGTTFHFSLPVMEPEEKTEQTAKLQNREM
jgi:PAS domain S-box-containing protein